MGVGLYPIANPNPDTGWIDMLTLIGSGVTEGSDFFIASAFIRVIGKRCLLRATMQYWRTTTLLCAAETQSQPGNLVGEVIMMTLGSAYRPIGQIPFHATKNGSGQWGCRIDADGTVRLIEGVPSANLSTDQQIIFYLEYQLD